MEPRLFIEKEAGTNKDVIWYEGEPKGQIYDHQTETSQSIGSDIPVCTKDQVKRVTIHVKTIRFSAVSVFTGQATYYYTITIPHTPQTFKNIQEIWDRNDDVGWNNTN